MIRLFLLALRNDNDDLRNPVFTMNKVSISAAGSILDLY